MKTTLKKYSVKDICEGFVYNELEGKGLFGLNGKLIELKSSKNLGLNSLIDEILKAGKAVCVGTDKAKIPGLVELFAAKIGAKVIYPKEDLKAYEKRKITGGFKAEDEHQHDALASSLFALRKVNGIIERINSYADENKKQCIKDKILDLVLTKEISIREAVDIIESPGKEETRIIKRVVEEKKLDQSDFMSLYRQIKNYEKENCLLKRQNNNLKSYMGNLEKEYSSKNTAISKDEIDKKIQKRLLLKENSIRFLGKELGYRDAKIRKLLDGIKSLNSIISGINRLAILKKLDNLGSEEFNKKKGLLSIAKGDILMANNPNIISRDVAELLKNFVEIIVTKIPPSGKIRQEYDFIFVDYKNLKVEETELFAFIPKEELKAELESKDALRYVIDEYKKKRSAEIIQAGP